MTITVVGGVYYERSMHPSWNEQFGSGGRAAIALAASGADVSPVLYSYVDTTGAANFHAIAVAAGVNFIPYMIPDRITFHYTHGLATPEIRPWGIEQRVADALQVRAERLIRFGFIEGDAVVHGDFVVYDPQNVQSPQPFAANGSTANHLALVLNQYEAAVMSGGRASPEAMAKAIAEDQNAEVVIIKLGPYGAMVYHQGQFQQVPAYRTDRVWPIGSGDTFVAYFGLYWMHRGFDPVQAATLASRAAAYYCWTQSFATHEQLTTSFNLQPITLKAPAGGVQNRRVYLAGPFFTLAQRWLIEQARENLLALGLQVFSPFHDVGLGSAEDVVEKDLEAIHQCDLMFAIMDGLDAGTLYEIGYARALQKPVVVYCENESQEDQKMMQGSQCALFADYATAIYHTLWQAIEL